jgi:hypothetical protein
MSIPTCGSSKPSDTTNFTGQPPAYQATSGTVQTGGWAAPVNPTFTQEVLESLPAVSFVTCTGQDGRLKQAGTKQQLSIIISLSGDAAGYTLTPSLADAKGHAVTAVGNYFYGVSRQKFVATFVGGKIVPVGVGQTSVEVRYPVAQVNANWSANGLNAAGSGGANSDSSKFLYLTINVYVTK